MRFIQDILMVVGSLVISLYDKSPYNFKRYDSNSVVNTYNFIDLKCTEVVPTLWGLSTLTRQYQTTWNPIRREIMFSGKDVREINIPSQTKRKDHQCYQIIYCDDSILVTRQPNERLSEPDLYNLWKRKKTVVWKKY